MTETSLTVLEAGRSQVADLVSGESLPPGSVHRRPHSCCVLTWQRAEGAVWVSFIRPLVPLRRAPSRDLITHRRP